MVKPHKEEDFKEGDFVYHKTAEEKVRGIVIAVNNVEVDWGPEIGVVAHDPRTLTHNFTPKFD